MPEPDAIVTQQDIAVRALRNAATAVERWRAVSPRSDTVPGMDGLHDIVRLLEGLADLVAGRVGKSTTADIEALLGHITDLARELDRASHQ